MDNQVGLNVFYEGVSQLGIKLTPEIIEQFSLYYAELLTWKSKMNLIGYKHEKDIIGNLFIDSLAGGLILTSESQCVVLDIGSGAGFPGIPLKIVFPNIFMNLLEPNSKKVSFLHNVIGVLGLQGINVESTKIEKMVEKPGFNGFFDLIFMKGLRLDIALPYVRTLLAPNGKIVLFCAKSLEKNKDLFGFSISREISYELPFDLGRRLLVVLKLNH